MNKWFPMNIVQIDVKNLGNLIKKIIDNNYSIEYKIHTNLNDQSKISVIKVKKNERDVSIIIAHYITQFYSTEYSDDNSRDSAYDLTSTNTVYFIPVNPVIVIILDNNVMDLLMNYRDDYPIDNCETLVNKYRLKNPGYRNALKILLARVLEELRGGD